MIYLLPAALICINLELTYILNKCCPFLFLCVRWTEVGVLGEKIVFALMVFSSPTDVLEFSKPKLSVFPRSIHFIFSDISVFFSGNRQCFLLQNKIYFILHISESQIWAVTSNKICYEGLSTSICSPLTLTVF